MSEVPKDVYQKAMMLALSDKDTRWVNAGEPESDASLYPMVLVAGKAILAERARCAAVARSRINMYGEADAQRDAAALSIAQGIESGEIAE